MPKIGIAYNIFQGTELLTYAIKQIRPHVDFVLGCVQTKSWTGQIIKDKDLDAAMDLKTDGLIDQLHFFTPENGVENLKGNAHKSEASRLQLKAQGCTHFIISDVDEIYHGQQFEAAKNLFIDSRMASSACLMETYYKEPIYQLTPRVKFYVPFMYKMDERQYKSSNPFPVHIDPTRVLTTKPSQLLLLKEKDLLMHHYSYIRQDLSDKTDNSAHWGKYKKQFGELVDYFNMWKYPQPAMIGLRQYYAVKEVDNYFGINI